MTKKIAFIGMVLYAICGQSETYSWKQVAPFPYYLVEEVVGGNGVEIARGRIIEKTQAVAEGDSEVGTTPFFMVSKNDTMWTFMCPRAHAAPGARLSNDSLHLLKIMFVKNAFVALATEANGNSGIYYSDSAVTWQSAGIPAQSLVFVKERLLAVDNSIISVSEDGVHWNSYGPIGLEELDLVVPQKNRTITVVAEHAPSFWFNTDSSLQGYYADSTYVLTDNVSTVGISRDCVHWRVVGLPYKVRNADIESVTGYLWGNNRFVFVTSPEETEGYSYSSIDGKKWETVRIDTADHSEGEYFMPPVGYSKLEYERMFYVQSEESYGDPNRAGPRTYSSWFSSHDGKTWDMDDDSYFGDKTFASSISTMPGQLRSKYLWNRGMRFQSLGSHGLEPVEVCEFYHLLYRDSTFIIPIDGSVSYQFDYSSKDGYSWKRGTSMVSDLSGSQWFTVGNSCGRVNAVTFGAGRFVAVGGQGNIWVLEQK
jgi:hypothetical protein